MLIAMCYTINITKEKFMKNSALKVILLSMFLSCLFVLTGCFGGGGAPVNQFGEFGYNGIYLTSFATADIDSEKAKEMITSNSSAVASVMSAGSLPDSLLVNSITSRFAGCKITTKFYVEGSEDASIKTDYVVGTELKNMIANNEFVSFSQLVAKYIVCYPAMIDYMESLNQEFKQTPEADIAPFKNIFSYHTNNNRELVIHTRDFDEIPASVGGGVGCSYMQDTEILYDKDNKIQKWQTSLGLRSATPEGTMKQGYILEMQFEWEKKA